MNREATISRVTKRGVLWHRVRAWEHGERVLVGMFRDEQDALTAKLAYDGWRVKVGSVPEAMAVGRMPGARPGSRPVAPRDRA